MTNLKLIASLFALVIAACGENLTEPPVRSSYGGGDLEPLPCSPNLDGQIDAAELPTVLGNPVTYLVSPQGEERSVDLVGQVSASGVRVWDWSQAHANDQQAQMEAAALRGRWYADSFPDGQFVMAADPSGRLETIYARDADALWILGFASREPDPHEGRTLLVYGAPVLLYRFPLELGDTWESVGEVRNGLTRNLPYAADDTYRVRVAAAGRLELPDLTFTQALQVHMEVSVDPAVGPTTSVRQASFLFECFGEVARATSRANEPEQAFTTAAEIRRLGL